MIMALKDKEYRLITLVTDICPIPLRRYFLDLAKSDTSSGVPFTTLDNYMVFRHRDVQALMHFPQKSIRRDQYDLIYPNADETKWDVSLLSALLLGLFENQMKKGENSLIKVIREKRNKLRIGPRSVITDYATLDLDWNDIETATQTLALIAGGTTFEKEVTDQIQAVKVKNIPRLDDKIRSWYGDMLIELKNENKELREEYVNVKKTSESSLQILQGVSYKRPISEGASAKKVLKTVDIRVNKLRDYFRQTIERELPEDFKCQPEEHEILRILEENHCIVVTGSENTSYLATVLSAIIRSEKYPLDRCFEIKTVDDWNCIDPNETDLVLFTEPFAELQNERDLHNLFKKMLCSCNMPNKESRIDVVIVSENSKVNQWKENLNKKNEIFKNVVEVFMPNAENNPLNFEKRAPAKKVLKTVDVRVNESRGDDDVVLDPFLCSGSLEEIRKLIESGKLPSQKILDEMCQIYERKSQEITISCKAICEHIKSKHVAIAYVWAAYTIQNPHRITFVVIVEHKSEGETSTEPLKLDKLITYSFVNQYVGEFNSEGPEVLRQETSASEGLDEESYQKLQSCISKHSEDLMKRHKYLSIISACSNRSRGFGASWNLLPEKCIVLYVQKKRYIPIDEEPFETHYDGIPVDVREGVFVPFGRTAKDLLDPVKMGSQIGGDNYEGTLGFFIDHPQFGICGLTCAHVLLTRWEMIQLKIHHGGSLKWPLHRMCKNVYQPADKQSVLGHTVQVIYKEGSNGNCGMELALFRITDRHPKSPSFPDETGSNVATCIKYDSWRMCSTDRLNKKDDNHVIKFGSKTELSHGIIKFDTTAVKSLDHPLFHECAPMKLFKQIEVKARSNGIPFAEEGDSGAPVFVVEKNSQNKCIGIIEGGTSYGTVVVTPIVPILAELDVPCLKSFDTEKELTNIQNKIDNIETQVQRIGSDMQTIKQLLSNHPQNFDSSMTNSPNDQYGHD